MEQVVRVDTTPAVNPTESTLARRLLLFWALITMAWWLFAFLHVPVKLKKGVEYTLHLSSVDVNHGFSLFPVNINIQVIPGYDYGLRVTPNQAGDLRIICNEFCGIGHHLMVGKVLVEE